MHWTSMGAVFFGAWVLPWFLGGRVISFLSKRAVMDVPNERSSHFSPVPRGGGLMVIVPVLLLWLVLAAAGVAPIETFWIVLLTVLLAALSWMDDRKGLSVLIRLGVQVVAVGIAVTVISPTYLVFQGLVSWPIDRFLSALLWIWFVNLFNFMDGIDGISGVETMTIGGGLFAVTLLAGAGLGAGALGLLVAGAALGFLRWNWPPAKVFLGDVGSVPLGFLLGWLLLELAAGGLWSAALILPLYYLADASITLGRRAINGERVWQAHRSHFYQRAAAAVGNHKPVTVSVALTNVGLFAAALLSVAFPLTALGAAAGITTIELSYLLVLSKRRAAAP